MGIGDAKRTATAAPPATEPTVDADQVPNYYCLGKDHAARLVTAERFFRWDGEVHPAGHPQAGELVLVSQGVDARGVPLPSVPITSTCPVCPVCSRKADSVDPFTGLPREMRVSAVPLEYNEQGDPLIPASVRDIAARAGEA